MVREKKACRFSRVAYTQAMRCMCGWRWYVKNHFSSKFISGIASKQWARSCSFSQREAFTLWLHYFAFHIVKQLPCSASDDHLFIFIQWMLGIPLAESALSWSCTRWCGLLVVFVMCCGCITNHFTYIHVCMQTKPTDILSYNFK